MTDSGDQLLSNASLLGSISVNSNAVDSLVSLSSQAMIDFINADTNGLVTFILTRDSVNSGLQFSFYSKDNTSSMEPPTLNLSINPGKFIIPARADAYIRGDQYYTNNYGHVTALALKGSTSTEYNRKAYLGFEVPDREEGDAVLQAGLRVELNSRQDNSNGEATAPLNVWGLKESPSGDSWVEGDGGANLDMTGPITWNNAPGIDASSIDMDSDEVVLLGTLPIADKSSGDILTLESAAMREFIAADTNGLVTIILQSVEDRSSDIKSKENSGASIQPTLDLLFGPSLGTMIMVQ